MSGRSNFSIHSSADGLVWKGVSDVYGGGAAYSDLSLTQNGDVAFVFERDNYQHLSFGVLRIGGSESAAVEDE